MHANVHEYDVHSEFARQSHRGFAIRGFTDHLKVREGREQHAQSSPDQWLVIGEEHPY
jgi:sarcosine oxidase gamma subunit